MTRRLLPTLAAILAAAIVLALAPAAGAGSGAGSDTSQPVPGGPVLPTQGFDNVVVSVTGCQPVRNVGYVATLDVSFQLHFPDDDADLQVRKVHPDGTKGAWGPEGPIADFFWFDTGSPVLWHWRSPLMQGRWELRVGAYDPLTGQNLWHLHPTLLDACPRARF